MLLLSETSDLHKGIYRPLTAYWVAIIYHQGIHRLRINTSADIIDTPGTEDFLFSVWTEVHWDVQPEPTRSGPKQELDLCRRTSFSSVDADDVFASLTGPFHFQQNSVTRVILSLTRK